MKRTLLSLMSVMPCIPIATACHACLLCSRCWRLELSLAFEDNSFPSGAFQTVELELSLCEITN